MAASTNTKLNALESMRGIAALSVAIYHCRIGIFSDLTFISNAWMMVDFFFVLSGFVIALNYQSTLRSFKDLYNFQLKRFFRLYPLHILTLVIFLAIEILKYFAEIKFGMEATNPAFTSNNRYSFTSHLFLIQNFTSKDLTWNYVSWSISAEFYAYFLFALMLVICGGKERLFVTAAALTALLSLLALMQLKLSGSYESVYSGSLRCLYSFFLGVLTLNIYKLIKDQLVITTSWVALFFIFMSIFAISCLASKEGASSLLSSFLFAGTIVAVCLTSHKTFILKILHFRGLVYLGTISYGVYMIHPIVWWFLGQISRLLFDYPIVVGKGSLVGVPTNIMLETLVVFVGLMITLCLSKLSFDFIEIRASNLRHRFLL